MAVIYSQTMPADVPIEMLDDVTAEMGVDDDPPVGMLIHTHYMDGDRVAILDVWESAEAHQKFEDDRLRPAMAKVAARRGRDLMQGGPPTATVTEVHRVVRGR
ncbi:MAG: hypothetical protein JWL64_193 [Frankiales bacterium]|nr:hypothetical protein [Frankiales bacterium]